MAKNKVCKWYSVCPLKRFLEQGSLDKEWVKHYCRDDFSKCERYNLEEQGIYHPDNMMPDGTIDKNLK